MVIFCLCIGDRVLYSVFFSEKTGLEISLEKITTRYPTSYSACGLPSIFPSLKLSHFSVHTFVSPTGI